MAAHLPAGGGVPGQGRHHRHGDVPGGQGVCGGRVLRERSRRHVPGGVPAGLPEKAGYLPAAVQDRHPRPGAEILHRLHQPGSPAGRRAHCALLLRHRGTLGEQGCVPRQLDQRRNQAGDFGEHPPLAPVWRADRGHRPPVLPQHRGQGGALPGQAPAPAVHRALRPGHRGDVFAGDEQLLARGRAGGFLPHHPRPGARPDTAHGLRH